MHQMKNFENLYLAVAKRLVYQLGILSESYSSRNIFLFSMADFEPATSPDVIQKRGGVNHPLKFLELLPCFRRFVGVC